MDSIVSIILVYILSLFCQIHFAFYIYIGAIHGVVNAFVRPAGTAKRAQDLVQPTHSVWPVEMCALARTMPIATPSPAPASVCQVLIQHTTTIYQVSFFFCFIYDRLKKRAVAFYIV